jgi:hypothetical protein
MASLEQLQMLEDDESTTSNSSSSSSSSSNKSNSSSSNSSNSSSSSSSSSSDNNEEEDDDDDGNISTTKEMNAEDTNGNKEVTSCTTTYPPSTVHHKKRLKLSLGGSFKAMLSESQQKLERKDDVLNNSPPRHVENIKNDADDDDHEAAAAAITENDVAAKIATNSAGAKDSNESLVLNAENDVIKKATNSTGTKESNESLVLLNTADTSTTSSKEKCLNSSTHNNNSHKKFEPSSSPQKKDNQSIISVGVVKEKTSSKTKEKPIIASTTILLTEKNSSKEVSSEGVQQQQRRKQQNKSSSTSSSTTQNISSHTKKRKSVPIRLPPMSSPGLLLTGNHFRGAGSANQNNASNDLLVSPNVVFTKTMGTAGYTTENRTKNPHRGSSIQLVVDDLFDSNIGFCRRFPELVPKDLITVPKQNTSTKITPTLPERLIKAFQINNRKSFSPSSSSERSSSLNKLSPSIANSDITGTSCTKRDKNIPKYSDMIPLSLTLPYPDKYIEKRLEYVKEIGIREKAIVTLQKEQEPFETTQERRENSKCSVQDIPPIPVLPDSPTLSEMKDIPCIENIFGSEEQHKQHHPFYLPKNKMLVDHLDKRCFHIVEGRYFGLLSNSIADPHFFGPSATGIGNLSSSSGLSTATFGGPLLIAPAQPSSTVTILKSSSTQSNSTSVPAKFTEKLSPAKATANKIVSDDNKPNGAVNNESQKAVTISAQLKLTKPSSLTTIPAKSTTKLSPVKATTDNIFSANKLNESPKEIGHNSATSTDAVNNEPQKAVIIS